MHRQLSICGSYLVTLTRLCDHFFRRMHSMTHSLSRSARMRACMIIYRFSLLQLRQTRNATCHKKKISWIRFQRKLAMAPIHREGKA